MAGIIKADGRATIGTSVSQPVAFNLDDISQQADRYLATVRQQAAEILTKAKHAAEKVRADSIEAGRADALVEAERLLDEKLQRQVRTLLPALDKSIQALDQTRQQWIRQWDANLLQLATTIAERIVRRELSVRPEISLEWIREAIELAAGTGALTIQLNPVDHAAMGLATEEIVTRFQQLGPMRIVADSSISAGGCKVVSETGEVDQQLETQLARIAEELSDE